MLSSCCVASSFLWWWGWRRSQKTEIICTLGPAKLDDGGLLDYRGDELVGGQKLTERTSLHKWFDSSSTTISEEATAVLPGWWRRLADWFHVG